MAGAASIPWHGPRGKRRDEARRAAPWGGRALPWAPGERWGIFSS